MVHLTISSIFKSMKYSNFKMGNNQQNICTHIYECIYKKGNKYDYHCTTLSCYSETLVLKYGSSHLTTGYNNLETDTEEKSLKEQNFFSHSG